MGTDVTRKTPRDVPPGTFFAKEIVPPVRKLLEEQGVKSAAQELTRLVGMNRRRFGLAIDKDLSTWIRQHQPNGATGTTQKRMTEEEIRPRARDLLLREVDPLFSCALGLNKPEFCEQLLKTIEGVQAFGAYGYQTETAHTSARNPIAYFWAVLQAFESGDPVSKYLQKDLSVHAYYERQTRCANHLLLFIRQVVRPNMPGYEKVQKLHMNSQQEEPERAPSLLDPMALMLSMPTPAQVGNMPTEEITVRRVELIFEGKAAIADYELFARVAQRHGGVEGFIRHLAGGLRKQGKR